MTTGSNTSGDAAGGAPAARSGSTPSPRALLKLARPKQWAKNVFVFIGPLYAIADQSGAHAGRSTMDLLKPAIIAAVVLSLASSACYIFNDLADIEKDRLHPRKRRRPLASGAVTPGEGKVFAFVLLAVVIGLILLVPAPGIYWLSIITGLYVLNTNLYSFYLKHKAIADVMCLSLGFVLRVLAGCGAASVQPSTWLLNCTLFLAMFLSFGKRLGERRTMGEDVASIRGVQAVYTDDLLRMAVGVTAVATLITYAGYIQFRDSLFFGAMKAGGDPRAAHIPEWIRSAFFNPLWLTMLPATYGLLRCIVLLERGVYDDPTELATKDRATQVAGLVFALVTAAVVLGPRFVG